MKCQYSRKWRLKMTFYQVPPEYYETKEKKKTITPNSVEVAKSLCMTYDDISSICSSARCLNGLYT